MSKLPILYSFRRCPYAMRARLALKVSGITVELREVVLAKIPQKMVACSPKATVPVLVLPDGRVIDESLDIMQWALFIDDPENWLADDGEISARTASLIKTNDNEFKEYLDHYKYAVHFPEHSMEYYRSQGEEFLQDLELQLKAHDFLLADRVTLADMAIFPFIRQFAHVDKDWFYASSYQKLQQWLDTLLASPLVAAVMTKYKPWQKGAPVVVF